MEEKITYNTLSYKHIYIYHIKVKSPGSRNKVLEEKSNKAAG